MATRLAHCFFVEELLVGLRQLLAASPAWCCRRARCSWRTCRTSAGPDRARRPRCSWPPADRSAPASACGTLLMVVVCTMSQAFWSWCGTRSRCGPSAACRRRARTDLDAGRLGEELEQRQAFLLVGRGIDDQLALPSGRRRAAPGRARASAAWPAGGRETRERQGDRGERAQPACSIKKSTHSCSSPESSQHTRPPIATGTARRLLGNAESAMRGRAFRAVCDERDSEQR